MNPDDQIQYLKRNYGHTDNADLAKVLRLSEDDVVKLANMLNLGKDKKSFKPLDMPRWTPEEKQTLVLMYPDHSNEEIARAVGRTTKAVIAKANYMGLKKTKARLQKMGIENLSKRAGRGPDGRAI
jgi:hypothetical protein